MVFIKLAKLLIMWTTLESAKSCMLMLVILLFKVQLVFNQFVLLFQVQCMMIGYMKVVRKKEQLRYVSNLVRSAIELDTIVVVVAENDYWNKYIVNLFVVVMFFIVKLLELMNVFFFFLVVVLNVKSQLNKNYAMASTYASSTFLIKMFFVFLFCMDLVYNIVKLVCMKNIKKVFVSIKLILMLLLIVARARFAFLLVI